ncbi:DUF1275 domain-containing protein [Stakelama sp. CBK3Z-3]|uniref:DUF1275 domain-containing protein n=1 Tax=Stakelama flava TaxID=2860338 RepID=A0ABS6XK87_9SPHN|nr:YoaK family protein [Stakelama flava]MBW4330623.1 DUF1275 domain-containing protein [Stakelama flava]
MQRTSVPLFGAALLLAALAGFVDVLAYTSIGGFFASFMSGNTTQLGIGLGYAQWGDVFTAGSLITAFLCGVVVSAIVAQATPGTAHAPVMMTCTVFLVIAAILRMAGFDGLAVIALAAGMGAENGVFSRNGDIRIGLTYMTGTLVRFGQKLANSLMGRDARFAWVRDFALWLSFFGGTVIGAIAYRSAHDRSFWIAALVSAVMTALFALLARTSLLRRDGEPA